MNQATLFLNSDYLWGKIPWSWGKLKAGGEGDNRGQDGQMVSLTSWTWVWASSWRWWWTGKPGMLQSMGSQRVRHGWATEQNWVCGERRGLERGQQELPYFWSGIMHGTRGSNIFFFYVFYSIWGGGDEKVSLLSMMLAVVLSNTVLFTLSYVPSVPGLLEVEFCQKHFF